MRAIAEEGLRDVRRLKGPHSGEQATAGAPESRPMSVAVVAAFEEVKDRFDQPGVQSRQDRARPPNSTIARTGDTGRANRASR